MQVIKPSTLSLLHQTYFLKGHQFVVTAMSFFKLGNKAELLPESEQWLRLQPYLNEGVILDTGHAKGYAEMLIAGCAFAPQGKPIKSMTVSAHIADVKKSVQVVGDRTCTKSSMFSTGKVSSPLAFTKMPLGFPQSYGGVGFADNEMGKGVRDKANYDAEQDIYHLANLYLAGESIQPDKNPRKVASFLPRDITHPQRTQYQGTYDQTWLDHVQPGFPDDTQMRLFNTAPAEQQQSKYFLPNAAYSLTGLHPSIAKLEGHLPSVIVRAFVTQQTEEAAEFKEIATQIDTVWFFPELELGIAIHRGVLSVQDSAGLDIKNLLLAIEGADDKPRDIAYFKLVLKKRLDPKTAAAHAFHASQLLPQLSEAETIRRAKLYAEAEAEQQQKVAQQRYKQLKKLQFKHPELDWNKVFEQENDSKTQENGVPGPIPKELLEKGDFDLSPYIEWSRQQAKDAKDKMAEIRIDLELKQSQRPKQESEIESSDSIMARSNAVVLVQAQAKELAQSIDEDASAEEKQAHIHRLMQTSQRRSRQLAPAMRQSKVVSAQGAQLLREQVLALMKQGESLAGRDLAGADLSGLDLRGQDLRDVMLEGANLTRVNFTSCPCDGLVLTEAQLDGAVFNECRLVKANLSNITCDQTQFQQAVFDHTIIMESAFGQCDFTGSDFIKMNLVTSDFQSSVFTESKWHGVQLVQCKLANTLWKNAKLTQCTFLQGQFRHVRWQGATLFRCALLKSEMVEVSFESVSAQRVLISVEGECPNTVFTKGDWEYCSFRELSFVTCDLSGSVFKHCDFSMATFKLSAFRKALLQSCLLFQTCFTESDGIEALFYESNLRKAVFTKTNLSDVTFHQTNLRETQFDDCKTSRLKRFPLPSLAKS